MSCGSQSKSQGQMDGVVWCSESTGWACKSPAGFCDKVTASESSTQEKVSNTERKEGSEE